MNRKSWRLLRYFYTLVVSCGLFFAFCTPLQTFACSTCTKPPADLELYFTTMDKLLGVLDTPPYAQWTWNQFTEDAKEVAFSIKSAVESIGATTMMSSVLFFHTAFLDMWAEIRTLAWTAARRRDREQLLDYDRKIMQKWLTMGQRAYVGKNISEDQLKKIDEILKPLQFVELNKTWWSYISLLKQATYDDILSMYRNLNYLYKKLHQKKWFHRDLEKIGTEYDVADELKKAETVEKPEREALQNYRNDLQYMVEAIFLEEQQENRGVSAPLLTFKEDYKLFAAYVWQIQQEYACAIGTKNQCDTTWRAAIAESRKNTKGRTADVQKSMTMFANAWARLKGAFWWGGTDAIKAAQQREEALLESFYGWDVPPERKWFDNNPGLADGKNAGISVLWHLNIEETSVETQGLVRRLQDAFKKQDDGTREPREQLSDAVSLSNVPQDDAQADANKYPDREKKSTILKEYIETPQATRRLEQEISLQWISAAIERKTKEDWASITFKNIFVLQQDRERNMVFSNVRSATVLFPVLSAAVWRNIELWGDKNEPSGEDGSTIYNSAGKICELQCSNLQGKCWYYTN